MIKTSRNINIDVVRGLAAIIVVLGHVIQLFDDQSDSFLSNVIFSIQIPLFMIVSGYTAMFSKVIDGTGSFFSAIKKKTIALLLPWFVWSLIWYVTTSNKPFFAYVQQVSFQMEGAYWFLFSLWCIQLMFSIASLCACKTKNKTTRIILTLACYGMVAVALLVVGIKIGITFLGIKYTLYYSPYFLLGWLIAKLDVIGVLKRYKQSISIATPIVLLAYIFIISKFNVIEAPDSIVNIAIRIAVAVMGCFVVVNVFNKKLDGDNKGIRFLVYAGNNSLEFYVIYLLVCRFISCKGVAFRSVQGILYALVFFSFLIAVTTLIIHIINSNKYTRFFFFAKK